MGEFDLFAGVDLTEDDTRSLQVVKAGFIEGQQLKWEDLFSDGFSSIKIITYSSSLPFLHKLLEKFKDAEVIFGSPQVMSFSMTEIMAFQAATMETIRNSAFKEYFFKRLKDKTLRMYAAREMLSHEKLYLLSSEDGRRRVITGSANMSYRAFSGNQRENIVYMDGDEAYDYYDGIYTSYINTCTDNISQEAIAVGDAGANMESLPVSRTIQVNKVLMINSKPEEDIAEGVKFVMKVNGALGRLVSLTPKTESKNGFTLIRPNIIKTLKQNFIKKVEEEKTAREELPMLRVNADQRSVSLNGQEFNLSPESPEISNDVDLFLQYMDGYAKFTGEWAEMQSRYYAFANWFFCSPFMAKMRNTAKLYNMNISCYPVFGIVYGESKAGKTSFLKLLLKMMIGQSPILSATDFKRTVADSLRSSVEGVPIVYDDVEKVRFDQHAPELIKNEDFGYVNNLDYYPAIVFSANSGLKSIKPEYSRRSVCVSADARISNENILTLEPRSRKIYKGMKTSFYKEYLRRMLEKIPALVEMLKAEGDAAVIPDILQVSSETIMEIIREYSGKSPAYVRKLSFKDYFGSEVISRKAKNMIVIAWKSDPGLFKIDAKKNELMYTAEDIYTSKRLFEELPVDLECNVSHEKLIMRLDKAKAFFEIDFKKPHWWSRF